MIKSIVIALWFAAFVSAQPTLQLHVDPTELSGSTNGSKVMPAIGPTGVVMVNGTGAVNFTPVAAIAPGTSAGTGMYFTNCCLSTNNAYLKFSGTQLGAVFSPGQGQISFYLTSRYSFAQRQALSYRMAFDLEDVPGTHELGFYTIPVAGTTPRLEFVYYRGLGTYSGYLVPVGTEDLLFGNGVRLKVTLTWGPNSFTLSLNDAVVQTNRYAVPTFVWTSTSALGIGAQSNGYNASDDVIDEFSVSGIIATSAPLFTSAASAVFAYGSASSVNVTAVGSPSPLIIESGSLPAGVSFNAASGALSGNSTASGTYTLNFSATNSVGTASQLFTLVVGAAPPPPPPTPVAPSFTSPNAVSFTAGIANSFNVGAAGTPSPALSESGSLPTGVAFDPMAGTISGTAAALGAFPVTLTAANSAGSLDQAFVLTVTPPSVVTLNCPIVFDALAKTLTVTSCAASPFIPASAFTSFSIQIGLSGGTALWQIDNKKFLAAFGSNP